jgi:hypothetical protein
MEDETNIAVPSYKHEHAVQSYKIESLGDDFEIDIPPQNVLMCVCAFNIARREREEDNDVAIVTTGGTAQSNQKILKRMNEISGEEIRVITTEKSNSIATNISSLNKLRGRFVILSQEFAKGRTSNHSGHFLRNREFNIRAWEKYIVDTEDEIFSNFEWDIIKEVAPLLNVPYSRTIIELGLRGLAFIDPSGSLIQRIANRREEERKRKPKKNIFTKTGTD